MLRWSIYLSILGIFGTGGLLGYLRRRGSLTTMEPCWFLGVVALAPAWLVCIFAILGQSTAQVIDTPLPRPVLYSSAAALLGIIFSDVLNRRLEGWGFVLSSKISWGLGVGALVPAWFVTLWVLQ